MTRTRRPNCLHCAASKTNGKYGPFCTQTCATDWAIENSYQQADTYCYDCNKWVSEDDKSYHKCYREAQREADWAAIRAAKADPNYHACSFPWLDRDNHRAGTGPCECGKTMEDWRNAS